MHEQLKVYEEKMQKTMKSLDSDLAAIRAGRANPHILDRLTVDYYGIPTPIQQVANVSVPEARMIQIQPWEKSMLKEITKAIQTSDIGINPTNDGQVIRLVFPELTDGNDACKKLKGTEISEDEIKDMEDELQKMTDKYIKEVDSAVEAKTKEVMTV